MNDDLRLLIGKLNEDCRDALEQAAAMCDRQMHDTVEIEHLLLALIALPAPDVDLVLRRFDVKPEAVTAQLTSAMDRFKTGNWRTPALSPHITALLQEAWQISSKHLGEQFVRSGSLVLALLQVDSQRSRLLESAPALLQIPLETLRGELPEIVAESIEGTMIGREPYRFDFFQAVRLLELLRPQAVSPGHGGSNLEPVAFRSKVGLDFPASDIVSAEFPKRDRSAPVRLTVAFMGLAGDSGPLPTPFTELIIRRTAAHDYATRDFLDIFNHRLISFLYRSRKKHRIALDNRPPEQTECAQWLFGLAGLEFAAAEGESGKWARSLLRYAGILSHQVRSMAALEAMLSDFFKTTVRGEQLLGRWLVIAPRDRTRIGRRKGANQRLGVDTVLGKRAWDQMGQIRLRIAAPNLARLREFLPAAWDLPAGKAFQSLSRITRVHLQQDIDIELRIALEPGQISGTRLGRTGGSRLGWTSWLNTGRSRPGDDPVRLRLPALFQDRPHQMKAA